MQFKSVVVAIMMASTVTAMPVAGTTTSAAKPSSTPVNFGQSFGDAFKNIFSPGSGNKDNGNGNSAGNGNKDNGNGNASGNSPSAGNGSANGNSPSTGNGNSAGNGSGNGNQVGTGAGSGNGSGNKFGNGNSIFSGNGNNSGNGNKFTFGNIGGGNGTKCNQGPVDQNGLVNVNFNPCIAFLKERAEQAKAQAAALEAAQA